MNAATGCAPYCRHIFEVVTQLADPTTEKDEPARQTTREEVS